MIFTVTDLAGELSVWKCEEVRDELGEDWIESSSSLSSGFFKISAAKQTKNIMCKYYDRQKWTLSSKIQMEGSTYPRFHCFS